MARRLEPRWTPVGAYRASVGESAVWSAEQQALWSVDVWGKSVRCCAWSGAERVFAMPEMAGAVLPAGRQVVVALETGLLRLDPNTGATEKIAGPADMPATHRFNDATVDPAGRLVITTMRKSQLGLEPTGAVYVFDGQRWARGPDGLWTGNGLAFSPDGKTLFFSDSYPKVATIWTASYDAQAGLIGQPRVFTQLKGAGRPDGACVDAEGGYWIAGVGGGELYRFTRPGPPTAIVNIPVENPTRVCFGGPNLDRLFVTSMRERLTQPDPLALAGALLTCNSPVRGRAPPALRF